MEGGGAFMSNTNYQRIEDLCWVGEGSNNIKYNQILNIIFSVAVGFSWFIVPSKSFGRFVEVY